MRVFIATLLSTFLFISCASKPPYSANYPLTNQIFQSRDSMFSGRIPYGWFSSTNDTLARALVVWLLKEDFSAAITVRELILDRLSSKKVQKDGLETLAFISAGFRSLNSNHLEIKPVTFKLNGKEFCSYELTTDTIYKRIVVFALKGKYYECESSPLNSQFSKAEIIRLFTIQQTVLSSITF